MHRDSTKHPTPSNAILALRWLAALNTAVNSGAIMAVYFLAAWWLRPEFMPDAPYAAGFLITIPWVAAMITWVLGGGRGLRQLLSADYRWWVVLVVLYGLWAAWSPQWALYKANAATSAAYQVLFALLFILPAFGSKLALRWVALALLAGLLSQALIVSGQVALQRPLGLSVLGEFRIRPDGLGLAVLYAGDLRLMRPYGLTIHPNVIGGYLAVALVGSYGLLVDSQRWQKGWQKWGRYGLIVSYAVGWWALLVTFSRSAYGGLAVGLGMIAVVTWRQRQPHPSRRQLLSLAALLLGCTLLFGANYRQFVIARAGATGDVTELRSISDRRVYMEFALQAVTAKPITGVGLGNFPWYVAYELPKTRYYLLDPDQVHSVPFLIASELGLTGLTLWASSLVIGLLIIWRRRVEPFGLGLVAGVVALLSIGLLDHYPHTVFHFCLLSWGSLALAMRSDTPILRKTND